MVQNLAKEFFVLDFVLNSSEETFFLVGNHLTKSLDTANSNKKFIVFTTRLA